MDMPPGCFHCYSYYISVHFLLARFVSGPEEYTVLAHEHSAISFNRQEGDMPTMAPWHSTLAVPETPCCF